MGAVVSPSDVSRPAKPEAVFDRDAEWDALAAFACDTRPGAGRGVISGRLRQGKTYLLAALTAALDGFCFGAQQATRVDSLHRLGDELARYTGISPSSQWRGWEDAADALLALGDRRPVPVVNWYGRVPSSPPSFTPPTGGCVTRGRTTVRGCC
ncbi:hypothetical protein ACH40E_18290 [Streptomyces acidicola]|uniref:hypothetical protein n=1 Tax=Streptomyces acidicola TaxID=2596892 RepID=UPI0037971DC5